MPQTKNKSGLKHEPKYFTIPQAAVQLGLPASALRRAVNAGFIPTHTVFNSRKRVRLSEIIAVIENQNDGGQCDE